VVSVFYLIECITNSFNLSLACLSENVPAGYDRVGAFNIAGIREGPRRGVALSLHLVLKV